MTTATAPGRDVGGGVLLALDQLDPNHWPNPRGDVDTKSDAFAELVASIREQGILEPIGIGPPLLELDGKHAIIFGWRRYTAARELGLAGVPVHQHINITDGRQALRAALAENMAREEMTPLAEASALARLVEFGDTQAAAAAAVGVSERTARERLRLLELPKPVREAIDRGDVPTTCTRQLQLIADASGPAATAIAKKIAKGDVRALELLDEHSFARVLAESDIVKAGLVQLRHQSLAGLGLSPAIVRDLKKRIKAANEYSYGDTIDLTPDQVGKKVLDEARAAGKLIALGNSSYLAGVEWIDRAARAAVEKMERAAVRRAAEQKRLRAARDADSTAAPTDPRARAQAERDALAAAIDKRAQPHAAAMNAEIGARLHALTTVRIDGPVARLLLYLLGNSCYLDEVAKFGYEHVDPDRKLADDWSRRRDPSKGAAEVVAALVAASCSDARAAGKKARSSYYVRELPNDLIREVAVSLKLLPPRAIALADARARHAQHLAHHDLRGARRRLLFELTKAPAGKLERDALWKAAKEWGRDAGDLRDVDVQVSFTARFDPALEQLVGAGHVKKAGKNAYAITASGRADLETVPGPAPIIEDIDADVELPADDAAEPEPAAADDVTPATAKTRDIVVIVHVKPTHGDGEPVEAELQPDPPKGASNSRKVIYTASRTAAWVAESRITDLPVEASA